jgi:hypothetical protein
MFHLSDDIKNLMLAHVFVVLAFCTIYYYLAHYTQQKHFSQDMTNVDIVYFTLTIQSTTGFGDITPISPTAKICASIQFVCGILLMTQFYYVFVHGK